MGVSENVDHTQSFSPELEEDRSDSHPSLEQLESNITELSAHIQAATYRLLCLVRTYDQLEGWATGGFVSCAHWLAWRTGDDLITAREKVRVARALEQLPLISAAFSRAELSYSKVRALTRIACPENEAELLVMGAEGTASQLERIVRGFRRAQPLELIAAQAQHENRTLHYHYNDQGMLELRVRLPPEAGALLVKALEAAFDALKERAHRNDNTEEDTKDNSKNDGEDDSDTTCIEEISHCQRQADAMVLLAESALDHNLARGSRAERYQVVVHVDAEALKSPPLQASEQAANEQAADEQVATAKNSAEERFQSELENGVGLCAETCRRLSCNSSTVVLTEDHEGKTIDVGRKTRRLSAALERALKSRDRGCQFPGCTHSRYVEAHHIVPWVDGGATSIENITTLCTFHHHAVHEQGFRMARSENGSLLFFSPSGTLIPSSPRPHRLVDDPIKHLVEDHRVAGMNITDQTGCPTEWTGLPFDLDEAVFILLPAEENEGPLEKEQPLEDQRPNVHAA